MSSSNEASFHQRLAANAETLPPHRRGMCIPTSTNLRTLHSAAQSSPGPDRQVQGMFRGLLPIDSLEYGDALATPHDLARPAASMHPSDMAMLPQRPMASSIATVPDVPHRRMKRDVVAEDVDRMRHQAFEYAQNTLPGLDGDMVMFLIAVVVTIGATAIADSIRHSNADIPTIVDWIAL